MKISKEIKTGLIALASIGLLVAGVNFLKGNSFFGGDAVYYAYFPNSGQLAPASSVTLNGVGVGKVLNVEYMPNEKPNRLVKVTFNIQNKNVKIPIGSVVEIGALDFLTKGVILKFNSDLSKGFYKPGSALRGQVEVDIVSQVKTYADPVVSKFKGMMTGLDNFVNNVSAFWDTTANAELHKGMKDLKLTITKFGNVADEVENLVATEKAKLGQIFSNVESITYNLKVSNEKVAAILGNAKKVTDDLVSANFKNVIGDAQQTLQKLNNVLSDAANGNGSLGKLLKDEKLYNELVETNQEMQNLVSDIQLHPERYIRKKITFNLRFYSELIKK
ncbi:MAG: MCE family protein [Flavobacteriia bacterium]|nr:MCE family protein [Flavobacteriia bacterium]